MDSKSHCKSFDEIRILLIMKWLSINQKIRHIKSSVK